MATTERSVVVGVFTERALADRAIEDLHNAGFNDEQIGFVARGEDTSAPDRTGTVLPVAPLGVTGGNVGVAGAGLAGTGLVAPIAADDATGPVDDTATGDSVTGAATGAVGGGILGGLIGAAAALLIPGIGPLVAGGILAAALGGAAIGAVAGGFIGALTSMGVPESEARYYQDELNSGRVVVTVKTTDRYDEALNILRRDGAYDASMTPAAGTTTTYAANTAPAYTPAVSTTPTYTPEQSYDATTKASQGGETYPTTPVVDTPNVGAYDPNAGPAANPNAGIYNPNVRPETVNPDAAPGTYTQSDPKSDPYV